MSTSNDMLATRRSLLGRLKDWGDNESWQDFFNTYWRLIYSVAIKSGLSDAEAQDVVQETVLTVAKKIGNFRSHPEVGSFKGWLLTITRRRIADQFAKRGKAGVQPSSGLQAASTSERRGLRSDDTNRTSTVERVPDPTSVLGDDCWEEQWQQHVLAAAIERVKNRVSPKQFQMFELYVLREWPVGKVAKTLGINSAQVYLAKHRISALLKKERERLEAQM